jgi:hypothetical protein
VEERWLTGLFWGAMISVISETIEARPAQPQGGWVCFDGQGALSPARVERFGKLLEGGAPVVVPFRDPPCRNSSPLMWRFLLFQAERDGDIG